MFLFCLFILCTSSTPPCEWTRCLSVCRQMEGLFPQFNEGRLLEAYPQLPWSLICSWGVHWHCLVSMEGTDPEAGWRASWQTAFQWMWTIGGTGKFLGPPCWDGQDKQGRRLDWVKCVTGRETKLLTWVFSVFNLTLRHEDHFMSQTQDTLDLMLVTCRVDKITSYLYLKDINFIVIAKFKCGDYFAWSS